MKYVWAKTAELTGEPLLTKEVDGIAWGLYLRSELPPADSRKWYNINITDLPYVLSVNWEYVTGLHSGG